MTLAWIFPAVFSFGPQLLAAFNSHRVSDHWADSRTRHRTRGAIDRCLLQKFVPAVWETAKGTAAMSVIDWSAIDWVSLVALTVLVLVAARIGERLSFGSRSLNAVLTAFLFAVGFAAWSYFSVHDQLSRGVAMIMGGAQG
jgi:hypothetical protein